MTGSWLRFICYSRIEDKTQATALTFLLSSVWHGFHPGYFVLFAHSYILVLLGRKVARVPHKQTTFFKLVFQLVRKLFTRTVNQTRFSAYYLFFFQLIFSKLEELQGSF